MIESNKEEKLNYKVLESFGLPYKNIISIFVKISANHHALQHQHEPFFNQFHYHQN
jgi:hypothetical protein